MNFAEWFAVHLDFLPPQAAVLITSMLPLIELRGGIPLARLLQLPLGEAILFSVIGNILPIPFILLLIRPIFAWLRRTKLFRPLVEKLEAKAMSKSSQIEKYEFWGLVLFVGIPLPGTGAWTGSLIASLLGIDWKKAFLAVVIGVCMATVIMYFLSYVVIGGIFG